MGYSCKMSNIKFAQSDTNFAQFTKIINNQVAKIGTKYGTTFTFPEGLKNTLLNCNS